ncbi:MAG: helix-turn-helix transcriptional regulator [Candidatus Aquilonibacter sp.]
MQSRAHTSPSRVELQTFLSACRARVQPSDVGLPTSSRRRVPGLRREEVAELVGVSAKWYAAFETGRSDRHFSAEFVHRVAEALRLDSRDRVWLFRLALPEAAAVAEHFESELSSAEDSVVDARAATGRAMASAVYRSLMAQERLREVQAAAGRAVASAVYNQLVAQESQRAAQAAVGRALASEICRKLMERRSA